ncbi:GerMN domain-containing protein [Nocardioides guangzhouensis]|uniref:GerMN domain-containing protein n=1 Tax=Nocardioides guangzhouensis TaxID=2497878 RepID=UPI0014385BA3|nr:GerMN domain-containing protein [Nocardioides guangzhouensis]
MSPRPRTGRSRVWLAALPAAVLLVAACGVPEGGSARSVDDTSVPYRLLDRETSAPGAPYDAHPPASVPLVFWLDDADRLTPAAAGASCTQRPEAQVEHLLGELAAGPTDEVRAGGRGSAIAPRSGLSLVRIDDGTALVEVDPGSGTSADRLPLAIGQIALTVTSARGVQAVALVSDGEPVRVPLPGGALTSAPVTATDYAALVEDRRGDGTASQQPGPNRWPGCPVS